jgi:hypothetical protein
MSAPKASRRFVPITLDNAWVVEYRVKDGGILRIEPGSIDVRFRFVVKHHTSSDGRVAIACQVRLADAAGHLWETQSTFTPQVFMEKFIDLSRQRAPCWLESAPEEWRQACARRLVMSGIYDSYDDRGHRRFYFDSSAFYFRFKYFGITYDIIHLESTRLLIRITQVLGSWELMPIEGPDGLPQSPPPKPEEDSEDVEQTGAWLANLDPLVYELDCRELLFHNTAFLQTDVFERYQENGIPLPVVFRRGKGRGVPQRTVTVLPDRSLQLPACPLVQAGEWMRISLGNEAGAELEIRSGGYLKVSGPVVQMRYRLGMVAGSVTEPVDVLCCVLRLADQHGDLWEAQGLFTPEVLLEGMVNLAAGWLPLSQEDGERVWQEAVSEGFHLSGLRGTLEGTSRFFLTDNKAVAVVCAGSRPRFDVAGHSGGLVVRLTGLSGVCWPLKVDYQNDYVDLVEEAYGRSVEEGPLPPIIYRLGCDHLPFRNTTFAVDDGFWHHNDLPIPLLFDRVEGKGEPQAGVQDRTGRE